MKPTARQATCDWCGKQKCDVQPFSDETGACFLCRQEARRQRVFDERLNRYIRLENP